MQGQRRQEEHAQGREGLQRHDTEPSAGYVDVVELERSTRARVFRRVSRLEIAALRLHVRASGAHGEGVRRTGHGRDQERSDHRRQLQAGAGRRGSSRLAPTGRRQRDLREARERTQRDRLQIVPDRQEVRGQGVSDDGLRRQEEEEEETEERKETEGCLAK